MKRSRSFAFLLFVLTLASCASYKQNIMFKAADEKQYQTLAQATEYNYLIQRNDILLLDIYTPAEKVIDPMVEGQNGTSSREGRTTVTYQVDINGLAKFPIIGELKVEGLTIRQAETLLQKEYSKLYTDTFVNLRFSNKRVIVLGTTHGQLVPLVSDNVRLTEVLAISKAVTNDAKVHNIRIVRDNKTYIADLSGIENYVNNDIIMMPNDIIYVEPVRRPFVEAVRDYGFILSMVTSFSTLILVIVNSTN